MNGADRQFISGPKRLDLFARLPGAIKATASRGRRVSQVLKPSIFICSHHDPQKIQLSRFAMILPGARAGCGTRCLHPVRP